MKKFLFILFFFVANSIGAQNAPGVQIHDTRLVNAPPSNYTHSVNFEFKFLNVIGSPGAGYYGGLMTIAPWKDPSGNKNHQLFFNDGGVFYRSGIHGEPSWEGWQKLLIENGQGNVGIGISTPQERLSVNGNIRAKEVKVEAVNWPDYVFQKDYKLPSLEQVKKHIHEKGHLPNIPTAKELEENGVSLGEMNKKLLEKIEELTLYIIKQEERMKLYEERIEKLEIINEK